VDKGIASKSHPHRKGDDHKEFWQGKSALIHAGIVAVFCLLVEARTLNLFEHLFVERTVNARQVSNDA
jgi:hypothetical protein